MLLVVGRGVFYLFSYAYMLELFKIADYSLAMASQLALAACSHVDHSKGSYSQNKGNFMFAYLL